MEKQVSKAYLGAEMSDHLLILWLSEEDVSNSIDFISSKKLLLTKAEIKDKVEGFSILYDWQVDWDRDDDWKKTETFKDSDIANSWDFYITKVNLDD